MKMIWLGALALFILTVGLAPSANAAGTVTGLVVNIRVDADGRGMVQFDTTVSSQASCGTALANSFGFDTKTAGGKAVLTLLTSAKLSGKKVQATGSGLCTVYSNAEDYSSGVLQP